MYARKARALGLSYIFLASCNIVITVVTLMWRMLSGVGGDVLIKMGIPSIGGADTLLY